MSEEIKPLFDNIKTTQSDEMVVKLKKEIKTFVIVNPDGTESGQYTGRAPRQAAMKAIKEINAPAGSPVTIRIRARGTKRIHVFRGHVTLEKVPEKHPAWMKADAMIKVAHVAKVGVEKVV